MSSSVLVGAAAQPNAAKPLDPAWQGAAELLGAVGLAITAVALIDLGLAWTPFHFGSGEWEFGTVTRTLDSFPLITTGLTFLVIWSVVRKVRWAAMILGAAFMLVVVALIGSLVLYGLNVPVALKAVPAAARTVLERGVARTASFGLIYVLLYAWLGWFTWRTVRAGSRGGSQ